MASLFDPANAGRLSLKELYSPEVWGDERSMEEDGIFQNDHQSIRYCDLYWLALATHTSKIKHDPSYYERNCKQVIPKQICDKMINIWLFPNRPILNMSLMEVMSTLWGLEWYALCDLYQPVRDLQWAHTVRDLVELVRERLYYFATLSSGSSFILDANADDGYTVEVSDGTATHTVSGFSTNVMEEDYHSDDDTKRVIKEKQFSSVQWSKRLHMVNSAVSKHIAEEEEGGSYAPSNVIETIKKTTWVFAHDVNCTLRELDYHLDQFISTYNQVIWHRNDGYDLSKFRQHCHMRLHNFEMLIPRRKEWQYNLQCLASHRAIYKRKTNKSFVQPNEILANKLFEYLNVNMPKCFDDMILCNGRTIDHQIWLRVNTDFMFELVCAIEPDKGDVFSYLVHEKKVISRLRVGGRWLVHLPEQTHGFDSFTHAFVFYRRYQKQRNIAPIQLIYSTTNEYVLPRKVDLSAYDSLLFV